MYITEKRIKYKLKTLNKKIKGTRCSSVTPLSIEFFKDDKGIALHFEAGTTPYTGFCFNSYADMSNFIDGMLCYYTYIQRYGY